MAKLPRHYYQSPKNYHSVYPVYQNKGLIAKIARKLHNWIPNKWLFKLGWGADETDYAKTPIGKVVSVEDGVTIVQLGGTDD